MNFLCISSYFKGVDFLKSCKAAGNTVYFITSKKLENDPWPWESIDETFYMESDQDGNWNMEYLEQGLAHVMRSKKIDRVVALDDFDVEKGAFVREAFRIPGMGQTTSRHFRDKLAMRMKADEAGIPIPPFSALFNDKEVNAYIASTTAPWVVKPRSEASATGIKKVHSADELWAAIHSLGDNRHKFLVEQFKPGDVYHADALTKDGKVIFCRVSKYLATPFEVAHGGGIFRSATLPLGSADDKALQKLNQDVMKAFGMQFSASHTEFIRCHEDGKYYFLETSSRVGGANIAEMVEAASGINLWTEWAKLETAMAAGTDYKLPKVEKNHAGVVISLSRFEHPDASQFQDSEIYWRLNKAYHVGLIVKSDNTDRVRTLLDQYAKVIQSDFHASAPPPPKSVN